MHNIPKFYQPKL